MRATQAAISARRPTPSLARMCSTCALAVRVARPSRRRDLAVREAVGDERRHLPLATGQGAPRRVVIGRAGPAAEGIGRRRAGARCAARPPAPRPRRRAVPHRVAGSPAGMRGRGRGGPTRLPRHARARSSPRRAAVSRVRASTVEPACDAQEAAGVVDGRQRARDRAVAELAPRPSSRKAVARGRIGRGEVCPRPGHGEREQVGRVTHLERRDAAGLDPADRCLRVATHAARPRRGPTGPVTGAAARPSAPRLHGPPRATLSARSSSPRPSATNPSTWSAVIRVVIPPRPSCLACSATASASSQRPVAHRTWARCAAR